MHQGKYATPGNTPRNAAVETPEDMEQYVWEEGNMPALDTESTEEQPAQTQPEPASEAQPEEQPAPVVRKRRISPEAARRRKRQARNTRLFYSIYFIAITLVLCALILLMTPLHNWLVKFEASQPDTQCKQVYDLLFAEPDWGVLYDLAGLEATEFEGKDEYIHYMKTKVAGAANPELTYSETSAGLSGDHKYIVYLDKEKIATFVLQDITPEGAEYSQWQLGKVELFFTRQASTTVERLPGQTVFINGVALSEDYTVRTVHTKAEEYLPENVDGYRREYQHISGLLVPPETVEVIDANGNDVPLIFDMDNNIYKLDLPEPAPMTEQEQKIAMDAAKANALYAIRAITAGELRKYFDPNTQIYKDICNTPTFIQSYASYKFKESVASVSDFYRYSDNLFSARVTLQLDITRKDGSVKSLEMNTTYFLTKSATGSYLVTNITNVELQEQIEQVRLSFYADGSLMEHRFVDVTSETITVPRAIAPEGKVFKGWAMQTVGENGQITMTVVFVPGESGVSPVPADLALEPMTLHAVFAAEEAAQ